ncbi:DUF808 domain-containing protein [Pseudomonas putida]|uniref:DUF808 domain-containing protein n=1 Tax=Pseudomonas putida TaxID=303 RepID=A0A8I1EBW3_PSEPU|nr:DUF808 domain-containing protein [Pseudomonas putida]MBI6883197.1 DUF808 domain-containing protein [Pseudomonas putida]
MAGASLLTVLDDVTTLLDDVALLTKTTTQKTAGVLGDDLALNAQQVSGVRADRELPVVWAVAKGSLKNKAILVPGALLVSAFAPWAITPILMVGGAYLCYEGFEKIAHKYLPHDDHEVDEEAKAAKGKNPAELEKLKINGAIRTDAILSLEITAIALGTVANETLLNQFLVLTLVALLVTVGVYGLVAAIVRMDDVGFWLEKKKNHVAKAMGRKIILAAPVLMRILTFVGVCAMFAVGSSLLTHQIPVLSNLIHLVEHTVNAVPVAGSVLSVVVPFLLDIAVGIAFGGVVLAGVTMISKLRSLVFKTAA